MTTHEELSAAILHAGRWAVAALTLDQLGAVHGQGHNQLGLDAQRVHVLQQARCLIRAVDRAGRPVLIEAAVVVCSAVLLIIPRQGRAKVQGPRCVLYDSRVEAGQG